MHAQLNETTAAHGDGTRLGGGTDHLAELVQRAQQGDASVVPQLRELLEQRPELWQRLGDVAGHVEEALLTLAGTLRENVDLAGEVEELWRRLQEVDHAPCNPEERDQAPASTPAAADDGPADASRASTAG